MRDALTDEEVRRLLAAPAKRLHGNGKRYRHANRDVNILTRMLDAGASLDDLCAGGAMGVGLSRRAVQLLVAKYAQSAGIVRQVTPTTLRRTFAMRHYDRYRSLPALARALGLASPERAAAYLSTEFAGEPMPASA